VSRVLSTLADEVSGRGGRVVVVGGAVRDMLLSDVTGVPIEPHDIDVEVYGVPLTEVREMVSHNLQVDEVGAQFSVLKVSLGGGNSLDISTPRREVTTGVGHREFDVEPDHTMTFDEAAQRRDITINAMGYDVTTGELLDAYGGVRDLRDGVIRHVSHRFSEDPLRPLRVARFAARLGFSIHPDTIAICRSMRPDASTIPAERIWGELRGVLASEAPGRAFYALESMGWLWDVFPEVAALRGVEQDPSWHPEGDVLTHTAHALDYFATHLRTGNDEDDTTIAVAILCHDLGKATTTTTLDGRIRSLGHEEAGVVPTRQLLRRLGQHQLADQVAPLVENHLAPVTMTTDRAVRRLSTRVPRLDLLAAVSRADVSGRPPLDNTVSMKKIDVFEDRVRRLDLTDGPPRMLARGEHLIAMGLEPGPAFKELLGAVYEAQLDGEVTTEADAVAMLRRLASSK
jgi:tRNA nucleotidyltransferase (CCA-adding enzyme)